MQTLRVTADRREGFEASAAHVVERILFGQRPAGGLRVGAQCARFRIFWSELLHDLGPQQATRSHLGDLHEEVLSDGPEEGQTRGKFIHV